MIKLTQIKSTIGSLNKHKKILRSLGLRKINHTIKIKNQPCIKGMIKKVKHMIKIEEED